MLLPRIIPNLLLQNGDLVKTVGFEKPRYIGDPINAVRIFNEKFADEIMITDISATTGNREPDYKLIEKLASESRMPMCYSGGIKSADQAKQIFALGVEKIGVSSAAFEDISILRKIADAVGTQSVVVIVDVKRNFLGKFEIFYHNGRKRQPHHFLEFIERIQQIGVGEIVVNSIDKEGKQSGYDAKLLDKVRGNVSCQFTYSGGISSLAEIGEIYRKYGHTSVALGSLFFYKGKYNAVLLNYPNPEEKESVFSA